MMAMTTPTRTRTIPAPDDGAPVDYHAMWWRSIQRGKEGQRANDRSTWKYDNLWKAACYSRRAKEAEALLSSAIDMGAHSSVIEGLVAVVKAERRAAHLAYLNERP